MPLIVDRTVVCPGHSALKSLGNFLLEFGFLFEAKSQSLKNEPECRLTSSANCLYVYQRELAVAAGSDKTLEALGSDMMTTCHIAVLHCAQTHNTALAHFDGCDTETGVNKMVKTLIEISQEAQSFDLHIVGGFEDDRHLSEKLSIKLLQLFAQDFPDSPRIELKTFCATPFNQQLVEKAGKLVKSPVIYGLMVIIDTGWIYPAVFDDNAKGPMHDLRGAKSLHGPHEMMNIYDWRKEEVTVSPFTYDELPSVSLYIELSDTFICKYFSTSPDVEPPNFPHDTRQAFRFIEQHPDPLISIFKEGTALRYQRRECKWKQIRS